MDKSLNSDKLQELMSKDSKDAFSGEMLEPTEAEIYQQLFGFVAVGDLSSSSFLLCLNYYAYPLELNEVIINRADAADNEADTAEDIIEKEAFNHNVRQAHEIEERNQKIYRYFANFIVPYQINTVGPQIFGDLWASVRQEIFYATNGINIVDIRDQAACTRVAEGLIGKNNWVLTLEQSDFLKGLCIYMHFPAMKRNCQDILKEEEQEDPRAVAKYALDLALPMFVRDIEVKCRQSEKFLGFLQECIDQTNSSLADQESLASNVPQSELETASEEYMRKLSNIIHNRHDLSPYFKTLFIQLIRIGREAEDEEGYRENVEKILKMIPVSFDIACLDGLLDLNFRLMQQYQIESKALDKAHSKADETEGSSDHKTHKNSKPKRKSKINHTLFLSVFFNIFIDVLYLSGKCLIASLYRSNSSSRQKSKKRRKT